jgi:hypothetical protein
VTAERDVACLGEDAAVTAAAERGALRPGEAVRVTAERDVACLGEAAA